MRLVIVLPVLTGAEGGRAQRGPIRSDDRRTECRRCDGR